MDENVKALKKALKSRSDFTNGAVVRWTSAGLYTYAAVYMNGRWYLSGTGAYYRGNVFTKDGFLTVLERTDTTNIEVAVAWESV